MTHSRLGARRLVSSLVFSAALFGFAGLLGCSGGGSLAPVSGKVTYNGKAVTGGSLSFSPIGGDNAKNPGKPGAAVIQSDGTFKVGTNDTADGAVVGRHKVTFSAPQMDYPPGVDPKPGQLPPKSGFEGLVVKQPEIEVKSGSNTIEVELTKPGS